MSFKRILFSARVMILIAFLVMSFVAVSPNPWASGLSVEMVESNSSAEINGLSVGDELYSINGNVVLTEDDFSQAFIDFDEGELVRVSTNKGDVNFLIEGGESGFGVQEAKTSNLQKGLDLVGGVRVVLKPVGDLAEDDIIDMIDLIEQRLNVFGVSDISIRSSTDIEGTEYIITELAGASKEEVIDLISKQGKFEARIGEEVMFVGGKDIKSVCRSADCSGIPLTQGCGQSGEGWSCQYFFRVDISQEAARKHADVTSGLSVEGGYLSKKLDLYLDDELVNSLFISESLKGDISTAFTIQGPGVGFTEADAVRNALDNMKKMQTLLITGSLPFSVEIERVDVISASLGENFFTSAMIAIVLAIFAVGGVIFARYRKLAISIPIIITGLSEVAIILGFAALIRWNLDLAAIAGIIAAVGTGVDDQIVITDEVMYGRKAEERWLRRMKRAFFIIFAAYFTMIVAMMPLWYLGAGILRGFALTTIVGVTIGVFVTRPAYAKMIEILLGDKE
tara:strand:- start:173 stop:1699 length:1527 start_codon:yes stop_codon:yes gene_type:complete